MRYILISFLIIAFGATGVFAQQTSTGNEFAGRDERRPDRSDLLRRELGLSDYQLRQIRMINRRMRPEMRAAQVQFREARQALDTAIDADALDDELLKARLKAVVEAQARVTRLRARSELAVRKVLNPEQLVKFRELRKRFERRARTGQAMRDRLERRERRNQMRDKQREQEDPLLF